jgi:hypothetical protein
MSLETLQVERYLQSSYKIAEAILAWESSMFGGIGLAPNRF